MKPFSPPRVLIIGGDGMIGAALARQLGTDGVQVACTTRRAGGDLKLDLATISDAAAVVDGFDCIVLAAAITGRAACSLDPDKSRRVNVDAPIALARPVLARGGHVVFLSTHAVLGGAEPFLPLDAPYNPPDLYAEQKAETEQALLELEGSDGVAIIRPTKVLSAKAGLIREWISAVERRVPLDVYYDLVMAPISAAFAAEQLASVIKTRRTGRVHLSGATEKSYADFALDLGARLGWPRDLLRALPGRKINPIAAMTPPHASLNADAPQSLETVLDALTADAVPNG